MSNDDGQPRVSNEVIEWLKGFSGAERARALIESGLEGHPDPRIEALGRSAKGHGDEYRERMLFSYPDPPRTREQYNQELRFVRMHGPRPKLQIGRSPEKWERFSPFEGLPEALATTVAATTELPSAETGDVSNENRAAAVGKPAAESSAPVDVPAITPAKQTEPDSLTLSLHRLLDEQRRLREQGIDPLRALPRRHQPAPMDGVESPNPFLRRPKLYSSVLKVGDAKKVYDAAAFGMRRYGALFNLHVTIVWGAADIEEVEATGILGKYLNEAQKWARRGKPLEQRQRRRPDMRVGDELYWVYVHENAPGRGFHTHILMSLETIEYLKFETWSRGCLKRLSRKTYFPATVLRLRRSYGRHADVVAADGWRWYRYVMKQIDPDAKLRRQKSLEEVSIRELLKPWHFRTSLPVETKQRVGVCQSLDVGMQRRCGYESKLDRWELDTLFGSDEYRAWEEDCLRLKEEERIKAQLKTVSI